MPRFATPVAARIRELREFLGVIRQGEPPILETFISELATLVDAKGCAYGVQVEEQGYSTSYCHVSGLGISGTTALKALDGAVRVQGRQVGFYTPARIEKWQRNVAVVFPRNSQILQESVSLTGPMALQLESFQRPARRAYGAAFTTMGIVNDHLLRVLVCEGSSLLSWVGALRSEPFETWERRVLQALVPALRERLTLESHWEQAVLNAHAVPLLLESIASPALLVSASGRIVQANALARGWLARDAKGLRELLGAALRGTRVPLVQLSRISARGWPTYYLAVIKRPGQPAMRTELARRRWNLTQREAELLVHLASGASNKTLAASLDCAVRTIEQHVTTLLEKMGAENRATAIARFWSELAG
ncbi:LuxR C-terminal-related transcriptional regulator [Archangium violaceum]|uniref:helix-turn-helix transcriptional regulator n=1 Tax=Archangium violaceum TaxID=83451 RepID=UPI002B2CCBF8|nr:LuxR C-terminal-related transcriptional regulator [Archangium gephyra]